MKKFSSITLALLAFIMLGACSPKAQGTTDLETPHRYTNPTGKEFPIMGWYSLLGEQVTTERYREMAQAGFNISFSHFKSAEEVAQGLEASAGTGVKILITCAELESDTENTVKRFRDHPQNVGYFLRDEPTCEGFPSLREFAERIRLADDSKMLYLNLLPNIVKPIDLKAQSYADYVARFIEEIKLGMVSFDHYPVLGGGLRAEFYANLEDVASESRKAGVPFWAFALSTAHDPYPIPTRSSLRLQIFSNLAYGAQGIQYFTYTNPGTEVWNFHNAPIDAKSQRTEVWDMVAELNWQVQSMADVFLGAELIALYHTGEQIPMGTKALAEGNLPKKIKNVESKGEGVIVSELRNGTKHYLMIVNRDLYNTQRVIVECAPEVRRVMPDGERILASCYSPSRLIEAGDMLLFEWEE